MRGSSWPGRSTHAVGLVLAAALVAGTAGSSRAQDRVSTDDEWCEGHDQRDQASVCEVREWTVGAVDDLEVNARPNGGIRVSAWERGDMQVRARIQAWADDVDRAREIVDDVEVRVGDEVDSDGPRSRRDEGWSVSYRLMVPRSTNLDLQSTNGGITIAGVQGRLRFRTTNGGVHLEAVDGDVTGSTTNGGLHVELAGGGWTGEGLDVQTTNGGVTLAMPEGYSAHLEASTTNGGFHIGFPVTVQGRIDRRLSVDVGGGGPTVRVKTTNGGVRIEQS